MVNQSSFVYKNIAIVRLTSLGDIIYTLPAFYLLRERYPEAKISWIVEPAGFQLLKNFTGIIIIFLNSIYKYIILKI